MSKVKLFKHQEEALNETEHRNRVAYYHGMGSGKTYTGGEKMVRLGATYNLMICQKSKVKDWVEHFKSHYPDLNVIDYTKPKATVQPGIIVVNYDLVWRRMELSLLRDFTLMLDESSLIQNENSKRSRFILRRLKPLNVILLSGTPTSGRYEKLWSQCQLLGWNISKKEFYGRYIIEREINIPGNPFPIKVVCGYKNVEELKKMLRIYGGHFLRTEDVVSLPEQTFVKIDVKSTPKYRKFKKERVVEVENRTLVGDTTLTKMLYERMLCGQYCKDKLEAFSDLLDSTEDRLIVFYNFNEELHAMKKIVGKSRPISEINGSVKDLTAYENDSNSITFIQYGSGAHGLNLQKADKTIYYTLPLSSEFFEQSKCRTHRIGQVKPCFYYTLICEDSIEEKILKTLEMRRDYTNALFEESENQGVTRKITKK